MRWTRLTPLVLLALSFALPAAQAAEQHGSYYENDRWGYKVRAPRNWKRRVIQLDEAWIADKFFPDYQLRSRNEIGEFIQHKPDLWVIGFPKEREDERVKVERPDENTTFITITNPYKDYRDFVERESWASTGSGGWHFSREDEIEHEGYSVTAYEIKVEKLVRAPLRIVTWVYHCHDVDFAVQVRILEEQYRANKNVVDGVVKSFREIPRTEPFPGAESDMPDLRPEEEGRRRTVEEIDADRLRKITLRINRETKNLQKGWRVQKSRNFVCLTQLDRTHTKYVLNFAEEIRRYLEKHFSELGPSELPPGLIRAFKSSAEENAYLEGTRGWWTDEVGEITMTWAVGSHALLSEFRSLSRRLTDQYFHVKNENLKNGMPGWIRAGIWGHIAWGRPSKRKKLILQPTPSDIRALAISFNDGSLLPLKKLMSTDTRDYDSFGNYAQANSVVHYLLNRGNKGTVKGAIALYLISLEKIIREEDEKFEAAMEEHWKAEQAARGGDEGKTEEELEAEEDERFRQRRQKRGEYSDQWKSKYAAIRERALEAAFGHLTDKDWKSLDKRWRKFAKP